MSRGITTRTSFRWATQSAYGSPTPQKYKEDEANCEPRQGRARSEAQAKKETWWRAGLHKNGGEFPDKGVRTATECKPPQPPAFPAVTHGSTRIALVPQTPYTCTRQDDWIQQTAIKFWGVKLTDAANPGYLGLRDFDDKVLNYEGVGSSISCRLNVRGPFKHSRRSTSRTLPLSVLRERDREAEGGTYKLLTCGYIHECNRQILTTNHKRNREHITRKKLAFEVAKLVRDHIEGIRVCVAFDSINSFLTFPLGRTGMSGYNV